MAPYQDEEHLREMPMMRQSPVSRRKLTLVYWTLGASIMANLFFLQKLGAIHTNTARDLTDFARLSYDTPMIYHNMTDFQSKDRDVLEKTWAGLDTDPTEIIISDDEAAARGLDISKFRFPWDETQGVYFVKAFHDLHCLKSMRHNYEETFAGNGNEHRRGHFYHCLDALRQSIQCHADDTPMPLHDLPDMFGNLQTLKCRNFDALTEWTRKPEHHACYHRFGDNGRVKHWLEQFAFCPENSPYRDLQQAYFAKWGHKEDMYAKEDGGFYEPQ